MKSKSFCLSALFFFSVSSFPHLSKASNSDPEFCRTVLTGYVRGLVSEKPICANCVKQLQETLESSSVAEPTLLVSFASQGKLPMNELMTFFLATKESGIRVSENFNEQVSYQHPSWKEPGFLISTVVRGKRNQIENFLKRTSGFKNLMLANYEILSPDKNLTVENSATIFTLTDRKEIADIFAKAFSSMAVNWSLIYDQPTRRVLVLIDEEVMRAIAPEDLVFPITFSSVKSIVHDWDSKTSDISDNDSIVGIQNSSGRNGYLISLNRFLVLQMQIKNAIDDAVRATLEQLGPSKSETPAKKTSRQPSKSNEEKEEIGKTSKSGSHKPIEPFQLSIADLHNKRAKNFSADGKAPLSLKNPVALLSSKELGIHFVIYYIPYLRKTTMKEVATTFQTASNRSMSPQQVKAVQTFKEGLEKGEIRGNIIRAYFKDLGYGENKNLIQTIRKTNKPAYLSSVRSDSSIDGILIVPAKN